MAGPTVALADGAELRVRIDGEGPDLLLVSGLGGTAGFWDPVVPAFARRHRVIRFDQRGIGASSRGEAPCTIDQLGRDCLAVLGATAAQSALLVGHSTGGCIVQCAARADPARVAGLVLGATWLRPNPYMSALFEARLALLATAPRDYAALGVLLGHPPEVLRDDPGIIDAAVEKAPVAEADRRVVAERIRALLAFDASGWTAELVMPRFVVGAEDDMVVPVGLQRELAMASPCRTHFFRDGGHFFIARRAEAYAALLGGWWDHHR